MSSRIARLAILGLVLFGGGLSGCSADDRSEPEQPTLPDRASAEHAEAVADHHVTEEEYTAGYRRFVACLDDAGYPVQEFGRPSTVYETAVPEAAFDSGAFDECYEREFSVIDILWQDENPPWTDAGPRLIACLEAAGLATDGNEEELKQRMTDHGLDVVDCILELDSTTPAPAPGTDDG